MKNLALYFFSLTDKFLYCVVNIPVTVAPSRGAE